MVKFYCDICGTDITGKANERLKGKSGRLSFEVLTAVDDVWNGGHVCHPCLIRAIQSARELDNELPSQTAESHAA